jgi:hypothetical protein
MANRAMPQIDTAKSVFGRLTAAAATDLKDVQASEEIIARCLIWLEPEDAFTRTLLVQRLNALIERGYVCRMRTYGQIDLHHQARRGPARWAILKEDGTLIGNPTWAEREIRIPPSDSGRFNTFQASVPQPSPTDHLIAAGTSFWNCVLVMTATAGIVTLGWVAVRMSGVAAA